jgi:hypothetical protein
MYIIYQVKNYWYKNININTSLNFYVYDFVVIKDTCHYDYSRWRSNDYGTYN